MEHQAGLFAAYTPSNGQWAVSPAASTPRGEGEADAAAVQLLLEELGKLHAERERLLVKARAYEKLVEMTALDKIRVSLRCLRCAIERRAWREKSYCFWQWRLLLQAHIPTGTSRRSRSSSRRRRKSSKGAEWQSLSRVSSEGRFMSSTRSRSRYMETQPPEATDFETLRKHSGKSTMKLAAGARRFPNRRSSV
ncbi:unnamed protein product [Chrysoparadoxa australica]